MITSFNIEVSMRKYLMDKYGLPVAIRKSSWKVPDSKPFYTVVSPTTTHEVLTKNKTLINSTVLLEIGCFADTIRELNDLVKNVTHDIWYENIPLLDDQGVKIGEFSFTEIVGDSDIIDDTETVQNETAINRRYIEARTKITYVKY